MRVSYRSFPSNAGLRSLVFALFLLVLSLKECNAKRQQSSSDALLGNTCITGKPYLDYQRSRHIVSSSEYSFGVYYPNMSMLQIAHQLLQTYIQLGRDA